MLDDFDFSVAGQLVGGAHHKVATKPPGRVCAQRGCRTRLSVYNLHTRCDLHDFDASLAHFHVAPVDDLHRKMVAEWNGRPPVIVDRRRRF
jgi:hypothetical protein